MVQMNNTPITLRVKFFKTGDLQYISHLDLVRTMMKIIVRAKLPLWYTEGFNPKPKVTFAAPLSTGTESICEYMDLRLTERISPEEALLKLNENMTGEMQATEAYYPQTKLTTLAWLEYEISINTDGACQKLADYCACVLDSRELTILKKTKSGEAIVDIKPLINSANVSFKDGRIIIKTILSADSSAFLNPEYLVKVLREKCGILSAKDLTAESYRILRINAYTKEMSTFV